MTIITKISKSGLSNFSVFQHDTTLIGVRPLSHDYASGMQRLPSEPIGQFNLTLRNVVIGSLWHVEGIDGVRRAHGTAASNIIIVPLSVYTSPIKNELVIKIGKASQEPYYRRYETQVDAIVGSQSIFINQERDDI